MRITALAAAMTLALPFAAWADGSGNGRIAWETMDYNFGQVSAGAKVRYQFYFTNMTRETVITVFSARPDCGCTVSNFTETVAPGSQGWVEVEFDSLGKRGEQHKRIQVKTSEGEFLLHVRGNVRGD